MGIKVAYNDLIVELRRVYAQCCSAWRAPWQVSGHFHSGTKDFSLPSSPVFFRTQNNSGMPSFGFSPSKQTMRRIGRAMVCTERISRAVRWPIGATRRNGHKRLCRHASNVWDSTSAAKWWVTLSLACVEWKITGSLPSKRSFAFPSSGFSRRRFKISMRSLRPIPIRQRNPGANANKI